MPVTIDGVGEINGVTLPTTSFGKVLQVVRATDSTDRTTSSTSFVDASISVTITPQKSTSAIILIAAFKPTINGTNNYFQAQITDSSNNSISGAQLTDMGDGTSSTMSVNQTIIGYSTPATTSATTYKLRFRINAAGTALIQNSSNTGQMYAIEVSA